MVPALQEELQHDHQSDNAVQELNSGEAQKPGSVNEPIAVDDTDNTGDIGAPLVFDLSLSHLNRRIESLLF